jgi:hypothetical protein
MKQFMRSIFLSVCTVLILASCHFNSQYINRDEDKKDAEKITTKLFDLLKTKNYNETTELFSNKFFEVSSQEKLFEIFAATSNKLGELQNTKIESWETKIVQGSNPSANYLLVYKNKYENFESKETFTLTKEKDGKTRIIAYNINSNGFLNLK